MNFPKISVCIPFYNLAPYVSRCMDSVLNNTYRNLEVICVNDGSTDGTSMLLHEYAQKDPRVIVVDKENGGIVSARQAGIDLATGELISFIDGDDWVHPQFFEILTAIQQKSKADAVVCDYVMCSGPVEFSPMEPEMVPYRLTDTSSLLHDWHGRTHIWGRIFVRANLPGIRVPLHINMGEDTAQNLSILCSKADTQVARIPQGLYYYFQREGSVVHTAAHAGKIDVVWFLMEHYAEMENSDPHGIVLHEGLRNLLSYRYLMSFSGDRATVRRTCKTIYSFCRKNWTLSFPAKERIKYTILYYCPFAYRLFRIVTDPTMLNWERAEKRRKREKAEQSI